MPFENETLWLTQAQIAELFQGHAAERDAPPEGYLPKANCRRRQPVRITYKFAPKANVRSRDACATTVSKASSPSVSASVVTAVRSSANGPPRA